MRGRMTDKPKSPALMLADKKRILARVFEPYLNEEMRAHFDPNNFHFREKYLYEFSADARPFSRAFLDAMFPRSEAPAELYHYTKMPNLPGIANSATLRLYAVRKRIDEGELKHFARDHSLRGYFESAAGQPYYKELSDDLFYTSFTPDLSNEAKLWHEFANQGSGVRLKCRLEPVAICQQNDICDVDLLEIQLGPNADRQRAEAAIAGTCLQSVPIV